MMQPEQGFIVMVEQKGSSVDVQLSGEVERTYIPQSMVRRSRGAGVIRLWNKDLNTLHFDDVKI